MSIEQKGGYAQPSGPPENPMPPSQRAVNCSECRSDGTTQCIACLRGRLRETAQILIAAAGADGPMDAEDAARLAVAKLEIAEREIEEVRSAVCADDTETTVDAALHLAQAAEKKGRADVRALLDGDKADRVERAAEAIFQKNFAASSMTGPWRTMSRRLAEDALAAADGEHVCALDNGEAEHACFMEGPRASSHGDACEGDGWSRCPECALYREGAE